jgi:hypothetical protein
MRTNYTLQTSSIELENEVLNDETEMTLFD